MTQPNTPHTPLLGLSTLIHLAIIIIASAILWFRKKIFGQIHSVPPGNPLNSRYAMQRWLKYILSLLIIIVMAILIIGSFVIALKTGLQKGSGEPQIKFLRNEFKELHNIAPDFPQFRPIIYQANANSFFYEYENEKRQDEKQNTKNTLYDFGQLLKSDLSYKLTIKK